MLLQLKKCAPKVKRILAFCACIVILGSMCCTGVFAADPVSVSEPSYAEAAKQVFDSVHGVLNFQNILAILGVALGACATLFLLWWGIRKVVKLIKNGLNGKLKV